MKLLANFAVVVPGKQGKPPRLVAGPLLKLPEDVQVRAHSHLGKVWSSISMTQVTP